MDVEGKNYLQSFIREERRSHPITVLFLSPVTHRDLILPSKRGLARNAV